MTRTWVLALTVASGCASPPIDIAGEWRMTGEAAGASEAGETADCTMDLIWSLDEDVVDNKAITYTGTHGGELTRTVLDANGDGFGFHVDVFGEVTAESAAGGALHLEIPINATGEGRFYLALVTFDGEFQDDGTATGPWSCEPLDLDQGGYVDETVIAAGEWTLARQ